MTNQRTVHIAASIFTIDSVLEKEAKPVTTSSDNFEELALDYAWKAYNLFQGGTDWAYVKVWDENMNLIWQCSVEFETTAAVRNIQGFAPFQS